MIYKCQKCGFIHEGEMPDGYFCPLCAASFHEFDLIIEEEKSYNRVDIDLNNKCINRILEKCINCGACRVTCEKTVGINYEQKPICIGCGKCIISCPTGAMTPYYNYREVWELINVPSKIVVVMTSPAVRVAIGDAFDFKPGTFLEGKMISCLKELGFDYVFDTSFGADVTAYEEAAELKERMKEGKTPLFTSCCPSWLEYVKHYHPELEANLSSCKSPIGMQASIIRKIFAKEEKIKDEDLIIVALTPCTSKKEEIIDSDCDYVITTSELAHILREQNIDFKNLEDGEFDSLMGSAAGTSFGASGGVMLSVLRCLYYHETGKTLKEEELYIKEFDNYNEYRLKIKDKVIKCLSLSTMPNFESKLSNIKDYDFVEVMNCEGGCIGGGGQIIMPIKDMPEVLEKRQKSLFNVNKNMVRHPYLNESLIELYEEHLIEPLSDKAVDILHRC